MSWVHEPLVFTVKSRRKVKELFIYVQEGATLGNS